MDVCVWERFFSPNRSYCVINDTYIIMHYLTLIASLELHQLHKCTYWFAFQADKCCFCEDNAIKEALINVGNIS